MSLRVFRVSFLSVSAVSLLCCDTECLWSSREFVTLSITPIDVQFIHR